MFSPDLGGSASLAARGNPRRRQRNASEDSVAIRQPVKRRKRSGLTQETFVPPVRSKLNGHVENVDEAPLTNGHTHEPGSPKRNSSDTSGLAIRSRAVKKADTEKRSDRLEGDLKLTKNENYIVTQLSTTPEPLLGSLKSEPWRGEISTQLGYAIAVTHTQAIIWRYTKDSTLADQSQNYRVRLLHPTNNARHPLPLGLLVPTSTEPALLIITPMTGMITYWESLSSAASVDPNRQKQQSMQGIISGMMSGEMVTKITEAEPRGFVLTFSTGRLAHLNVSDAQGKPSINIQFLRSGVAQSGGILGSLRGVFSSAGWKRDIAAVRAGRSVQRGQRYVFVATTTGSFQVWDLNWNGTQSMTSDIDAKSDLLKALLEGGEIFHDDHEHIFEVLDFAILPRNTTGKEVAKPDSSADCKLLVLTVLKGSESSKYALVGLTLANGSVCIDVVHPVSCYTSTLPVGAHFRPQVLVPEPGKAAIIVFETCIVMVSLVEIEETPDSQLQMEAHLLPDPFQDAISFRNDKRYRVVGSAAESQDRNRSHSTCVIMIHGFGMIRVTTLPVIDDQSALDRASVTARTKIEQAVFFGNLDQDLLDFSPRPETTFSRAEVETAVINISHSIVSSTSAYLPTITPSVEQQLSRRAMALADLNSHLRRYYPRLSQPVRWQLLWDAEKMAAAKALWRCYNATMTDTDKGPKNVFEEMIEGIPETYKQENQPVSGETDGVRHWFIHDVWRLEWVVPYSHGIIETLFAESREDHKEFDLVTKAKMISDAVDIQLAALDTAFRFREENAVTYGFEKESMTDGVLQAEQDFEGLPEFWTSSALVIARVKETVDVAREMAKLLAGSLEDYFARQDAEEEIEEHEDIDADLTHGLMMKLAKDGPRHIQTCCQTFIERFRWLKSREEPKFKAQGEGLRKAHLAIRREQFIELTDLEMTEEAIQLAEKYWDMEALVEILQRESDNPTISSSIPARVNKYFLKFGTRWADAYFTRHLSDGKQAVDILSKNATFKQHLTRFLRQHPSHANLTWINEITTERDFAKAASSLQLASQQQHSVWSQKVMSSMSKLSILAAKAKDQIKPNAADPEIRRVDQNIAVLDIQEEVDEFISLSVINALDNEARVDLAMERYGTNAVKDTPYLKQQLRQNLQHLIAKQALSKFELIDTLTLTSDDSVQPDPTTFISTRFFLALRVLKLASATASSLEMPSPPSPLTAKIIWRRVLNSSNWAVLNRTESKNDKQVSYQISQTALFQTLLEGWRFCSGPEEKSFWDTVPIFRPSEVLGAGTTIEDLRSLPQYRDTPDSTLADLARDLGAEDAALHYSIDHGRLGEWYEGVFEAAKLAARQEADKEGEETARKREVEEAYRARVRETGKEMFGAEWYDHHLRELGIDMDEDGDVNMEL